MYLHILFIDPWCLPIFLLPVCVIKKLRNQEKGDEIRTA